MRSNPRLTVAVKVDVAAILRWIVVLIIALHS